MNKYRKLLYWVLLFFLAISVVFLLNHLSNHAHGKLYLPPIERGAIEDSSIPILLLGIRVTPMQNRTLSPSDRKAFLIYVQQLFAIVEMPSFKDVYLSSNAQVFQVLAANFSSAKPFISDPSVVKDGMVSLKEMATRIQTLDL